ncbi:hypothetical protein CDD80_2921 [Ophiocordyceps camponoti-rufipedis]|uniref:Casein kinase II beta 2 subunit n=1 Tax=Ophiocordyceps camponoti-rufipedis TaxID=2004952 RepID=A0A2C5XWM0_9HYPO|nr:hypothetical protein CDD80_2921 [Ophiocordyceps camponoti-rufipedis]
MASVGAIIAPGTIRLLRVAASKASQAIRVRLAGAAKPLQGHIQSVSRRQPIHHATRQSTRWFSTSTTRKIDRLLQSFLNDGHVPSRDIHRFRLPSSNTSRRVAQLSGRAPFASTLRPNLTGGALPRTAGGYSLGGNARFFSHTPAAPAQVVQNVSQAMRAFFLSGQRLRYDGVGPNGSPKYRTVSARDDEIMRSMARTARSAPGAFIDFHLKPTITALGPLAMAVVGASDASGSTADAPYYSATLHNEGLLDVLSADFKRALQDLTAVDADLKRLSALGDLPVMLEGRDKLRVRFPGLDADTVERLCDDLGIQRGVVGQDCEPDVAAGELGMLKVPFAPEMDDALTKSDLSLRSLRSNSTDNSWTLEQDSKLQEAFDAEMEDSPWLPEAEGHGTRPSAVSSSEYEGLEGIYRFLEECNRGKGRFA